MLSPRRCRRSVAVLVSLLLALPPLVRPVAAAEVLDLRLDGIDLPVNLAQLEAWSAGPAAAGTSAQAGVDADLGIWLNLLSPSTQQDLRQLLRTPVLRERSFGRQLLDSWAGRQVLEEVGTLLTASDGRRTTASLNATVQRLLEQRRQVTAIELLRALPEPRLSLQLDAVLQMASQWRQQLGVQSQALQALRRLGLQRRDPTPRSPLRPESGRRDAAAGRWSPPAPGSPGAAAGSVQATLQPSRPAASAAPPLTRLLPVAHRREPLPLAIWPAAPSPVAAAGVRQVAPWVLLLPGLGGDSDQLGWLAAGLAQQGWSVVAMQHPGSDAEALRQALAGQRPPPGGESLALRLADIDAVLTAQRGGSLPFSADGVVLAGHSLGAVTALLAAGVRPESGLEPRCRRALQRLPFTNPSRLLQCQLPVSGAGAGLTLPGELRAVLGFNPFGSLLWPRKGLTGLSVPLLLAGGTLDLVTPPLEEQLALFPLRGNARNRLAVVEGGSHFSPVHVADDNTALFRLGDDLVGVAPAVVQELLLGVTVEFLRGVQRHEGLRPQHRTLDGVTVFVLDGTAARRWRRQLGG
ncbi:MAG: alpha/beta hydrolase [Synechococcaceae cyanobacterium]|nr:alpha/beta hydrolase [Synechococcaceae cyanobacterium]